MQKSLTKSERAESRSFIASPGPSLCSVLPAASFQTALKHLGEWTVRRSHTEQNHRVVDLTADLKHVTLRPPGSIRVMEHHTKLPRRGVSSETWVSDVRRGGFIECEGTTCNSDFKLTWGGLGRCFPPTWKGLWTCVRSAVCISRVCELCSLMPRDSAGVAGSSLWV